MKIIKKAKKVTVAKKSSAKKPIKVSIHGFNGRSAATIRSKGVDVFPLWLALGSVFGKIARQWAAKVEAQYDTICKTTNQPGFLIMKGKHGTIIEPVSFDKTHTKWTRKAVGGLIVAGDISGLPHGVTVIPGNGEKLIKHLKTQGAGLYTAKGLSPKNQRFYSLDPLDKGGMDSTTLVEATSGKTRYVTFANSKVAAHAALRDFVKV